VLIHRANRYVAEPDAAQHAALVQWVGACRYVYNLGLEQRRDFGRGRRLNYILQARELTMLRAEVDWLKAAPVHALQNALRAVDDAFQRFFAGLGRYPKPREKFKDDSFTLSAEDIAFRRLNKNHGVIRLPKIGWVRLRGYRPLGGKLLSVTFRRKAGRWHVSCTWEKEIPDPPKSMLPTIGIDRGVAVFAAFSDGRRIAPLNAFGKVRGKLAKLQRRLARKVKRSSNWVKLKGRISRLRHREANARKHYLHQLSTEIAKNHGIVKVEKLRVRNMSARAKGTLEEPGRNVAVKSGLNRSILDQGWSMFADMLRYKLVERGGELEFVNPAHTSQACPKCGVVDATSRRSQSEFVCTACGHADHADVVGARNIEQARTLAVEPPKRIRRRIGKRKPLDVAHAD
jgi:putative transposase